MRWPWQRAAQPTPESGRADAPTRPSPAGWAFLPPLVTAPAPPPTQLRGDFLQRIPTRVVPAQLTSLGHVVSAAAPAAMIGQAAPRGQGPARVTSPPAELTLRGVKAPERPVVSRTAAGGDPPPDSPRSSAEPAVIGEDAVSVDASEVTTPGRDADGSSLIAPHMSEDSVPPSVQPSPPPSAPASPLIEGRPPALSPSTGSVPPSPSPSTGSVRPSPSPPPESASQPRIDAPVRPTLPLQRDVRSGDAARVTQPPQTPTPALETASSARVTRPALGLGPPLKRDAPAGDAVSAQRVEPDSLTSAAHGPQEEADASAAGSAHPPEERVEPTSAGVPQHPSTVSNPAPVEADKTPSPVDAAADVAPLLGAEISTARETSPGRTTETGSPGAPARYERLPAVSRPASIQRSSEVAGAGAPLTAFAGGDAAAARIHPLRTGPVRTGPSRTAGSAEPEAGGEPAHVQRTTGGAAVPSAPGPSPAALRAPSWASPVPMPFAPPAEQGRSTELVESIGGTHGADGYEPAPVDRATEMPFPSEPEPAVATGTGPDAIPAIRPLLLQRRIEPTIAAATPTAPGRISAGRVAVPAQVLAGDGTEALPASARSAPMHASGGRSEQVVQRRADADSPASVPSRQSAPMHASGGRSEQVVQRRADADSPASVPSRRSAGDHAPGGDHPVTRASTSAALFGTSAPVGGSVGIATVHGEAPIPARAGSLPVQRVPASVPAPQFGMSQLRQVERALARSAALADDPGPGPVGSSDTPVQRALEPGSESAAPPNGPTPVEGGEAAPSGRGGVAAPAPDIADQPQQVEKLLDRLYPPLVRRLKAEMLLDRERRGVRIDRI